MRRLFPVVLAAVLATAGCSRLRRADDHGNPGTKGGASAAPSTSSAAPAVATAVPDPGEASRCGSQPCRLFPDARRAFAALLEPSPAVLAIGESHTQQGDAVEPTARRFMQELLPLLAGRASDLVVEIMLPNPKCAPAVKKAREEQKVVTEHQAKTDQDDFVALGTRAKQLGMRPHALEPTCDDLARIAKAGPDVVTVSLDVVTRLSTELVSKLYIANLGAQDSRMVVAYGGLMHNDAAPRADHARWSFGPTMTDKTAGRYLELDLVAPRQIKDSPTWTALPWVPGFDKSAHAGRTVLLAPAPNSSVLVFAE